MRAIMPDPVGAREHETVLVERDLAAEPVGARVGANEHEHRVGIDPVAITRAAVLQLDPPQNSVTVELPHLTVEMDLDLR